MSALQYVCLSDLHLGADYSLLTQLGEDGKSNLLQPSETLTALGINLRRTVKCLSGAQLPTLILMGDVLDLGQSPYGAVAQGFKRFIEALFPVGEPAVFSSQVLTVPGNHDHHLWTMAQDRHFLEGLPKQAGQAGQKGGANQIKPDFIHGLLEHTAMFTPPSIDCTMLTTLMRSCPNLLDANVRVAYPNLGFIDPVRSRCVVLHHGHYVDSIYLVMSELNAQIHASSHAKSNTAADRPKTVAAVERENGAWVDFLFSNLGNSGALGKDIVTLYATLRDAGASHQFAQKLSARLLQLLSAKLGVGPNTVITHGITVANVVKSLVDVTLVRAAESGRNDYASVMSADELADLRWYLSGPVRRQIADEGRLRGCKELSFVFGHTHKPFQDQLSVPGFARPVSVYNTGGWVIDQPTASPTQGAAALFIDDQLNLASLRLFNDAENGRAAPVRAAGVGGFLDQDNPLLTQMNQVLLESAPAWAEFSACVSRASALHARVLLQKFFTPAVSE